MKDRSAIVDKALQNLKIASLNEMQCKTLKVFSKKNDIVLLAPTGSGKTLGYLLPIIENLDAKKTGIQVLVIAPSRELTIQIEQVFKSMNTGFKVNSCYGGHMIKTEKNNLKTPPTILIGTPGRIADHIFHQRIDPIHIQTLVLDEFDKSLEFGFQKEMSYIIRQIPYIKKRILTSATPMSEIPDFTGLVNPEEINFLSAGEPTKLTLKAVLSEENDKLITLYRLICKIGNKPTLVFSNHRESVDRISTFLKEQEIEHETFHGGLDQDVRERTLLKFRNGTTHLLVTTDLAARGLDIPQIEFIVHYHLPTTEDAFTHRNGRTARMNASGTTYIILSKNEKTPAYLKEIPEFEPLSISAKKPEGSKWATLYIGAGKKDKINKIDIVGLLLQKGNLQKEELGLIDVQDFCAYVAVAKDKIKQLVMLIQKEPIKKKKVKYEIAF